MLKAYYYVVSMHGQLTLEIVLPGHNYLMARLFTDVDEGSNWLVELFDNVLQHKKSSEITVNNMMLRITIHESQVLLEDIDHNGDALASTAVPTLELYSTLREHMKIHGEFRRQLSKGHPWHGIDLIELSNSNKPYWETARYWDPASNKTGFFKDTPEGEKWIAEIKRIRENTITKAQDSEIITA